MFRIESTKQTLLTAEDRGLIPKAERVLRGRTAYRAWSLDQLPLIGEAMGFVKRPTDPSVIAFYSLKGGTAKSTVAFQTARTFALHNLKTLVIGLDAQESITQTLDRTKSASEPIDPNKIEEPNGIYQFLTKGAPLESLIQPTDLATLFYIPETIELSILDVWLNQQTRKEYIFRDKLITPLLKKFKFDVIIFDCNPAWNSVVTSALAASDTLISPLGADINSLKAARIFTDLLADFEEDMKHSFSTFFIVPTMVEANKLSQGVQARYRLDYDTLCTVSSIRRAVVVQEANLAGRSLMESAPESSAYDDFVGVIKEIADSMATPLNLEGSPQISQVREMSPAEL